MGDVGIVAGVLDHADTDEIRFPRPFRQSEGDALTGRQSDFDRVRRRFARRQRLKGGAGGGRGAGARGPAPA